ncbi:MAG: outer membrane protein assembly factor BamD [Sulfurovum sp.]|nr:outer membrane protein assembly factor BamD [Sulfurovum sp.]MCB4744231.1 outer membrane protein assembly factor BamD [Sulfurovum sp.]MCB4746932.1 outer membrane protein assembly factor BamD [Sulfurovum sp.]MCB4749061.1 outer membrane protein assembly factor BamD [Sulfurovum sp.]MCB4750865.1 outer membrane protein assembly factor BamD [Sulfurovum sp.]
MACYFLQSHFLRTLRYDSDKFIRVEKQGMQSKKSLLIVGIAVGLAFLFTACQKHENAIEFNKPALYWYKHIVQSIAVSNMDKADKYYVSLKSEHTHSPLLPTAIMILAQAHMREEEYLLANYYWDEYNKRYANEGEHEYTEFMKLKASFLGVKDVYKDQKLIIDSISRAKLYLLRYPDSAYKPMVNSLLARLYMSQYLLNQNIAALYDRIDKPVAAKFYRKKNKHSLVEIADITPPKSGFLGEMFN